MVSILVGVEKTLTPSTFFSENLPQQIKFLARDLIWISSPGPKLNGALVSVSMGIRQESASGSAPQVIDGTDLIGVKTPNASLI